MLAGESRLSRETLVTTCGGLAAGMDESLAPNLLVTLDGQAVRWGKLGKSKREEVHKTAEGTYGLTVYEDGPKAWQECWSAATGTHLGGSEPAEPFRMLVRWIRSGVDSGRTSDIRAFDRYFENRSPEASKLLTIPKFKLKPEGGQ